MFGMACFTWVYPCSEPATASVTTFCLFGELVLRMAVDDGRTM